MKRLSILMYHALYATEAQRLAIDPEDRPYAISTDTFARQLDLLLAMRIPVIHPRAVENQGDVVPGGVLLTFDDGHASNADLALPLLSQRGLSALFFVTTGFVGQRPGFCRWDQLRELTKNGMVIGGHGHTHRFLSDLSDRDALSELSKCKGLLEDRLQLNISQMSFPGGRYNKSTISLAKKCGYHTLYSSDCGSVKPHCLKSLETLPRHAIRQKSNDQKFICYARSNNATMLKEKLACSSKKLIKKIFGNNAYDELYRMIRK